jgi:uncharacterized membrane protein YphA (DoxX/SURF4 family)
MVNRIISYFKSFDYPVSPKSFALFRMLYALYLLGLISQLNTQWPFFFDHVPPYSVSLFPTKLSLFIWLISSVLLLTGSFTRVAAVINYVLVLLMTTFFVNANISSFNDDLLRIGGFLLIVIPASRCWSVDALLGNLQRKNQPQQTSYLYYLLSIVVTLGLLYFASAVTKLFSPMWQNGLGLWIPAVIPSYKWNHFDFFVDQKWMMFGLNYVVLAFEFVFIFLLFNKRFHAAIAIIGITFHLGIAFLFPFTYICFGPIFFYSLLIPDSWWKTLGRQFSSQHKLIITFNPEHTKQYQAVHLLTALDFRGRLELHAGSYSHLSCEGQTGWDAFRAACRGSILHAPLYLMTSFEVVQNLMTYVSEEWLPNPTPSFSQSGSLYRLKRFSFFLFVAALCWVQLLTLGYHSYTALKADKKQLTQYLKQRIATQDFSTKPSNLARTFFGINSRGVFLDHAFRGTKTVYAIAKLNADGTEEWLPIFTKEGYCTGSNRNLGWHKLSFKYFGRTLSQPDTTGFKKYTAMWAHQNHVAPHNLYFRVYRRMYPCPETYEKGYLTKMLNLPWDTAGLIVWNDTLFHYTNLLPDSADKN